VAGISHTGLWLYASTFAGISDAFDCVRELVNSAL
jgi:hypothetical protein